MNTSRPATASVVQSSLLEFETHGGLAFNAAIEVSTQEIRYQPKRRAPSKIDAVAIEIHTTVGAISIAATLECGQSRQTANTHCSMATAKINAIAEARPEGSSNNTCCNRP